MSAYGPEIVDIAPFLQDKNSAAGIDACKRLADTLKKTSCVIIKDPRIFAKSITTYLFRCNRR
jgi:hypothetical protein